MEQSTIKMDPEIAAIFNQSTATTVSKGISHCLLSTRAKRRRTKEEIKQSREAEQLEARRIQAKLEEHEQMQKKLLEQQQQLAQQWQEIEGLKEVKDNVVPGLVANGLLDHDPESGYYHPAKDWDHYQQIQAKN